MEKSFFFGLFFLGPHPWHVEFPRLGVVLELQLPATAIAMQGLSHVCELHHSSWQCQILNPLSKARDWTHVLMDTGQIHFQWAMMGTPKIFNREHSTSKAIIKIWWRNQKLYRQAKAKRNQHHQNSFTTNAKGTSLCWKEEKKTTTKNKKTISGKAHQ